MIASRKYPTLPALLTTVLFAGLLAGCGRGEVATQPQKKGPQVSIEMAATGEVVRSLDLTAEVVPVEVIQVSATVEGPIGYLPWREGDCVEAGQKLVEIDREMYRAELNAAEAALAVAQAKLADLRAGTRPEEIEKARQGVREAEQSAEFERIDLERVAQLVETGALPGEDVEKGRVKQTAAASHLGAARAEFKMLESGFTRTAIAVQEAVVKESAAKLDMARARLDECTIAAPFAGTITKVFARQGDMAAMKAPLLELADLKSQVARCAVAEANAAEMRVGMKARIHLDALPGQALPAEVARVFPELDPRMRTRTIELIFEDNTDLAPGMFGRVELILESVADAVTVPVRAVIISPSGVPVLFVANEGKAAQRKVETGIEDGGRIQILSGVDAGENVIISGQEKLKDGAEIRMPGAPGDGGQGGGMVGGAGGQGGAEGRSGSGKGGAP